MKPKSWRWQATALQIAALVLIATVVSGCSKKTPEDRIREAIAMAQKAAKEHRPAGVLDIIAQGFTDNHGNSRDVIKAILLREMMTNKTLGVYITTENVSVNGAEATVDLSVVITGSSGWLPEHADRILARVKMRETDGEWQAYKADWRLASGQEPH
jgi:hypothetical protein